MASRAQRLQVVLDMAEQAVNDAAEVFNLARTQYDTEDQKLTDLTSYCNDYQESLQVIGISQTVESIARSRGFLSQLTQAQKQQQQIVDQFLKLLDQKKQLWHKAHLKHSAMCDLVKRLKEDDQKHLNRQEEKMLDEWVTMGFARPSESSGLRT